MNGIRIIFILLLVAWTVYVLSLFKWVPELIANQEEPMWFRATIALVVAFLLAWLIRISINLYSVYRGHKKDNNNQNQN